MGSEPEQLQLRLLPLLQLNECVTSTSSKLTAHVLLWIDLGRVVLHQLRA
jgi:hypothetical protein